ncbi:MAG: cob(I)yrinic acid a,c-diamide adenosyltransferase [Muribaculaceae bacterium]|nr:cob(I)yrinic acid a,c-diamide adenosyltransferase [Muribaculaceae bacterium]
MSEIRKSVVYTRSGDDGTTSLVGGSRRSKDDSRIEAYGTIDELNSQIGLMMADSEFPQEFRLLMESVQNRLFDIGGYMACEPDGDFQLPPGVSEADVARLERSIDEMDARLPRLKQFVLPGGCRMAALAHVARTVARRAERRMVTVSRMEPVDPQVMRVINRLSDWFFVFARFNNINSGVAEIIWNKDC